MSISINQSLIQNRVDGLHTYTSQLWARPLNERSNGPVRTRDGPDININYNFGITFTASKAALASAWSKEDVKMFTLTLLLLDVLNVDG